MGLYVAIVLSAIMSTIDSLLVVGSSALSRDLIQKIFRPKLSEKRMTRISRWITLGLALFALIIALTVSVTTKERTIFWFAIFGWSGIAATFCPAIILSLSWKSYSEKGAIASMLVGFCAVPLFKFILPNVEPFGPYLEKLDVMAPAFLLSLIAGWLVTKFSK